MRFLKNITTILTLMLVPVFATAQSVNLRVDRQAIQGGRFAVTISVKDGEAKVTRDMAPKLKGCTLLSGPGVSTMQSVQIINGHQTSSVTKEYSFIYSADNAGTVTIPPIKVEVNGKEMQTKQEAIKILPPDQARRSTPGSMYGYPSDFDEMEEWMNQMMGGGKNKENEKAAKDENKISPKDFLVTVSLSKTDIYEKEATIATIKLYTKHNVTKFQPVVMPQFEGFLSEEIDVSNRQAQVEHYKGENYYSVVLKQCLLYPQKSGKLNINSGTYDVTLETVDMVSYGFYATPVTQSHNITTTSNSISINVKPLPSPQPLSFNGAVGDFNISSEVLPKQLRTNEAAKYILHIKGIGNLMHLAEPIVPFPKTVEEYTPTGESNAHFNGSNMQGEYTATYTFVPQETGTLDIPAWEFSYFNPATGKYVTTSLPSYSFDVARGIGTPASSKAGAIDTSNIKDIRHIVRVDASNLSITPHPIFFKTYYWLAYILALVALIAAVVIYRKRISRMADVQGQRIRKAKSVADKRLQKAREAMKKHNSDEFYAALSSALWGFLSDKLKIAASSLTRENISETLLNAGAEKSLVSRTIMLLDDCEMARFTPALGDREMSAVYSSASQIIDDLNRLKQKVQTQTTANTQSRYAE